MFCKKCGKELKENAKYCSFCGCSVTKKNMRKKTICHRIVCGVIIILVIVGAIVGAVNLYHYRNNELYEEAMAKGDAYMKKADYYHADDAYLQALKLQPELKDPYKAVARAYWSDIKDKRNEKKFKDIVEKAKNLFSKTEEETFTFVNAMYEDYIRYKAYSDILETQTKNGGGLIFTGSYAQTYGFCFAQLIDFDGDGVEELAIVYTKATYNTSADNASLPAVIDDYILEVWSSDGENANKVFTGIPFCEYGRYTVAFVEEGEQVLLKAGNEKGEMGYYELWNNVFQKVDVESSNMKSYLLQGNELSGDKDAPKAFDEWLRTEKKMSYKINAAAHAIDIALRDLKEIPEGALIGNYKYESDSIAVYVCGYMGDSNERKLYITYWTKDEYGSLEYIYNEEKGVYQEREASEDSQLLAIEEHGDFLNIALEERTEGKVILERLEREIQYDSEEMKQYRDEKSRKEQEIYSDLQREETQEKIRQLDEEGVLHAIQEFLDAKEFKTLDNTVDYCVKGSETVSRYSEAYWVPIFRQGDLEHAEYYAVVASSAFANPGETIIYSAEVFDAIIEGKKSSDFTELETFDAKKYIEN